MFWKERLFKVCDACDARLTPSNAARHKKEVHPGSNDVTFTLSQTYELDMGLCRSMA